MLLTALLAVVALQPQGNAADVRQLSVSPPQLLVQIDTSKLKGEPARLAWSADGFDFYLQTVDRDKHLQVKAVGHYLISVATKAIKSIDQEPLWATKYWAWKSGQTSPAAPAFRISFEERQERLRAAAAPVGGALARGGGGDPTLGSTNADAAAAADSTQTQVIRTLSVKGAAMGDTKMKPEILGEWINDGVTPGSNYTWAPAPIHALAYAKRGGGPMTVLDDTGHHQDLSVAQAAILPAWSDDGKNLAWLERRDKKKVDLVVADVTAR
jgi:hypothetical protein